MRMMHTGIIAFGIFFFSISLILNHEVYAQAGNLTGNLSAMIMGKTNNTESTNSTSGSRNTSSPPISNPLNSSYLTYDDKDIGFSIQYPSDWSSGYHNSEFGTVISFRPPDNYLAFIDVRVGPKGEIKSIKEVGDWFKESAVQNLLAYYRNSTTQLSGKPAFRAVYLVSSTNSFADDLQGIEPQPFKGLYIGTMDPEKKSIYALVYLANPPDFDKYHPVVEKMIDSFKIYGKGPVIQEDNSSSSAP